MATNIPAGFFALYIDDIGVKKSFWIASTFGLIGTCIRLGGVTKLVRKISTTIH